MPVRYYLRLADVLVRHGVDLPAVLRDIGASPAALTQADATWRFSQVEQLIAQINALTGRTDLGFELGKRLSVSTHSIVGFGMLSSPHLERALAFVARYFRLVMPSFRLRFRSDDTMAELQYAPVVPMGHECLAFHLDAMAMATLRDAHELIGGVTLPCRIDFSVPEPRHAARYAELRQAEVRFATEPLPGVRIRFEADLRAHPLVMADPNALRVAEERCRVQVAHVASIRQFAEWVAMTLREVSEDLPTLAELAAMLNISPRTLNRYLEREGTTFRELSGRIQHELACERLAAGASVAEVAYSLGFNDPANFTRSFRDRAQCSPREYRQRMNPQR